jgi:hypothetical protein
MSCFKGLYCGRMMSTQMSESMNRALKVGFVNSVTSLHQFARRCMKHCNIWTIWRLRKATVLRYKIRYVFQDLFELQPLFYVYNVFS